MFSAPLPTVGDPTSCRLSTTSLEERKAGNRVFAAILLFLLAALTARAQNGPDGDPDGAQGYVNNIFHHSSVDSINLYNGQLTIPIAIGPSYPIGPKLKFQAMLTYNSKVWEYGHPYGIVSYRALPLSGNPALGIGWNFTLGAIKVCPSGTASYACFVGPDGSQRVFDQNPSAGYFKTSDASQLYLHDMGSGGPYEMWDGDGNHYVFTQQVTGFDDPSSNFTHDFGRGRDGWYLYSLTDPFGNSVTVNYFTFAIPCWTYQNSCPSAQMLCPSLQNSWIPQSVTLPSGQQITVSLNGSQMIGAFTFPVFANGAPGTATWSLTYQTATYSHTCDDTTQSLVNLQELQAIVLPAGVGSYQFDYAPPTCLVSGLLTRMILPTGATVDYAYSYYSFYHARVAALSTSCQYRNAPPSGASVQVTGSDLCGGLGPTEPKGPQPNLPIGDGCDPTDEARYLNQQAGVVRRTETIEGIAGTTDYTQYAFPFGERGSYSNNLGTQTLTVVLQPGDVDGRRRAAAMLFWGGQKTVTLPPRIGDRTGADLEERFFDSDPNPGGTGLLPQPTCPAASTPNFCSDQAVRVTRRIFDYDTISSTEETGDRRLLSETTFYVPTAPDGSCNFCPFHKFEFSPSQTAQPGSWDANGRHYDTETHTGILGNDNRTITTTWTPSVSPWLPNLFNHRTDYDGLRTLDRYFEFTPSNGFPRGDSTYDSNRSIIFLTCRYNDGLGNAGQEFSATYANQFNPPGSTPCESNYATFPTDVVGLNGDAFGKAFTYQNGLLKTMRWINGNASTWYAKNYFRDSATGWVTFSSDPAGLTTSYSYDSLGRVTSIAPPGGDAATGINYDLPTQTTATRNGGIGLFTLQRYLYDGLGRLSREIRQMPANSPSGPYAVRLTQYDGAGHTTFVSEWAGCADLSTCGVTSPAARTSYSNFDPFGRAQTIRKADGATTTISFADGASLYSDTLKSVTVNNINGTCSNGCIFGTPSTTIYRSDAFGRLTAVTEPGDDVTNYSYDVNGKLTSVFQGSQGRTFNYDLAGFLRSESTPEKGTVSYDTYGSLGNLLSETEPGGLLVTRTYDFAGRLTGVVSGGQRYLTDCYDGSACADGNSGFAGGSYPAGKLTRRVGFNPLSLSTPSVTDDFSYSDLAGRLSSQTTAVAGGTNLSTTQRWVYNGLGLLAHYYHPRSSGAAPFVVSTAYDAGLPAAEYVNGIPMVKNIAYQASGALANYTTGIGITDVTTAIAQDTTNLLPRPKSISTTGAISNFATGDYAYDGAGNIMAMGSDAFGYDSRSRLTSAFLSGVGNQSFTYDRYGNLLSKAGTPYPIDPTTNHISSGAAYLRGNLTSYGDQTFTWDGLDRMISNQASTLWNYLYDGSDERIAKIPPTGNWTFTIRDESKRVASEYSATTPSRDNTFLGNQLAVSYANAAVSGNGPVWVFYASDHLGTPRLLTDVTGSPVDPLPRRYWPYGEAATTPGSFQVLRFATMELDAEGGTGSIASDRYYDHARSHVGGLGRFLSVDPAEGDPEDPQSWNAYAYASNNPLNLTDPLGFASEDPICGYEDDECTPTREGSHRESVEVKPPSFANRFLFGLAEPFLSFNTGSNNDPRQFAADAVAIGLNLVPLPVGKGAGALKGLLGEAIASTFRRGLGRVKVFRSPVSAFRFSSPGTDTAGRFLTTRQTLRLISSPDDARAVLNLPFRNTGEVLTQFTIPAGTRVFIGRIEDGAARATQLFIEDKGVLLPIR